MITTPAASFFVLSLSLLAGSAQAQTTVAVFDGGIGSQPLAGAPPNVIVNDVRGVPPGGRPWEIRKLKATVRSEDGRASIIVKAKGLILGGGNSIGLPGVPREVAATVFCGTNEAFNSASVLTNDAGDFEIRSPLATSAGNNMLPEPCAPATLLIRNAPGGTPGAWFAAGIPKHPGSDDD